MNSNDYVELRRLASLNPSKTALKGVSQEADVAFVPMEAVSETGEVSFKEFRPLADVWSGYTYFESGDVLVAKITPCFENGKGGLVPSFPGRVGFGTTEFHVLRPGPAISARYLNYVTRSKAFRELGAAEMKGAAGQQRVPEEFIRSFRVFLPHLSVQVSVADFLDAKTAAIDALIQKKQRLLELLEEKRKGLIHQAVTRGFDGGVQLQQVPNEGLTQAPAHWNAVRLKFAIGEGQGLQMGPFGTSLKGVSRNGGYAAVFGQANTISGDFESVSRWLQKNEYEGLRKYKVVAGDIVLTRKGSLGHCRVVPDWVPRGIIDSDTIRLRCDPNRLLPHFLATLLRDAWYVSEQVERNRVGAIVAGLNTTIVGNLQLVLPPLSEQKAIESALTTRLAQLEKARSCCEGQVRRLQEYRQALITAAVTGQLEIPPAGRSDAGVEDLEEVVS